jgi:hypothetical protein
MVITGGLITRRRPITRRDTTRRHIITGRAELAYTAADGSGPHPPSSHQRLTLRREAHWSINAAKVYLSNASANAVLSERSANTISGSIIQNSAKWRLVFEFSVSVAVPGKISF